MSAAAAADPDVEVLKGAAAMAHLQALQSRRRASFERAAEMLRKRGFKPSDHVIVLRTKRQVRGPAAAAKPYALVDYSTGATSDGEMDVWSWNDGDDGTWEGTIYAENYNNGSWVQFNAQVDVTTGATQVWEDFVGGYDAPDCCSPDYQQTSERLRRAPQAIMASLTHAAPGLRPDVSLVRWDWQGFYGCALKGCIAAAGGCIWLGPAWPECFFAGCTGAIVGCILNQLF